MRKLNPVFNPIPEVGTPQRRPNPLQYRNLILDAQETIARHVDQETDAYNIVDFDQVEEIAFAFAPQLGTAGATFKIEIGEYLSDLRSVVTEAHNGLASAGDLHQKYEIWKGARQILAPWLELPGWKLPDNDDILAQLGLNHDVINGYLATQGRFPKAGTPDNKKNVKAAREEFTNAVWGVISEVRGAAGCYASAFYSHFHYHLNLALAQKAEEQLSKPLLDYACKGWGAYWDKDLGRYRDLNGIEISHGGAEVVRRAYVKAYSHLDALESQEWGFDIDSPLALVVGAWGTYSTIRDNEYKILELKGKKAQAAKASKDEKWEKYLEELPEELIVNIQPLKDDHLAFNGYRLYQDLKGLLYIEIGPLVYDAKLIRTWLAETLKNDSDRVTADTDNLYRVEAIAESGLRLAAQRYNSMAKITGSFKHLKEFEHLDDKARRDRAVVPVRFEEGLLNGD